MTAPQEPPTPSALAALARDTESLPKRMRSLPLDEAGRPVPFFTYVDEKGKADHRIVDASKWKPALDYRWCWICGQPLGGFMSFAIGPMCTVNRISAEPPQHIDCATWSATHCPFLVNPAKGRREGDIPENATMSEVGLERNPGVTAVWSTKKFTLINGPSNERLVRLGDPSDVAWYHFGKEATREQVKAAFDSGIGVLEEMAAQDNAQETLAVMVEQAKEWWPA